MKDKDCEEQVADHDLTVYPIFEDPDRPKYREVHE